MEICGERYGKVCWGRRGGSGEVLVEMWESMLGCERRWEVCEKVLGRCGKVWGEVRCHREVWGG